VLRVNTVVRGKVRERLAPALVAAAVVLGAVPTAGLAVTAIGAPHLGSIAMAPFTPANVDPTISRRVAAKIAARGQEMRFTPAGATLDNDRTMTVAIRVGPEQARAISVRSAIAATKSAPGVGPSLATLAPTRYNLGLSRGYQTFAKPAVSSVVSGLDLKRIEMLDLAAYRPREGVKDSPSRLQPRIALESASRAGRSPRTLEGAGEQAVDLSAGYRLSRNLNVTAGVRLSQERDRLAPLTDTVRDDQSVYVGTQFRF
jgi:hypothetical protein